MTSRGEEIRRRLVDYVVCNTPKLTSFSLNKLIYLIEVSYFIQHQSRLTDIDYRFQDYGPYSPLIRETAEESDNINIREGVTREGIEYTAYDPKNPYLEIEIPEEVKAIADAFISEFGDLPYKQRTDALTKIVYSTAPLTKTQRYEVIDFNILKPKFEVSPAIGEARKKLLEKGCQ
jgi:uncharacterized protein YwgA